ncbi:S8 family serine peptidase [Streptosporangium sp. NBC_01495]|uniref:S8 family serine peptidase n=1 Tax=Streptosporangium sp. NBC_01495 TaxID=2903899 RepID=UPI002E359F13|nr:S8 family serine peptidase [Streptosporangium sp. NBC_01495]
MIGGKLVAGMLTLAVTVPVPASAAGGTAGTTADCSPPRGTTSIGESWAQRRFDLPEVWKLTRGAGVTVAIIDSGVDTGHPQLARMRGSLVDLTGTGTGDCLGHGTQVAGIVGGTEIKGVPFAGVAPGARLISIKHTNEDTGDAKLLAHAILRAVRLGADVINVSAKAHDQPDLRRVVNYALSQDVVVVAAAGNVSKDDGTSPPAYPAAYPGVISVGSAGPDGTRASSSSTTTPVSVLAPGVGITSTSPGRAYAEGLEGTSFATPYVAGVAALVRARHPRLDHLAVQRRIRLTSVGGSGTGTGAGMINPLLAVSAILPSESVAIAPDEAAPLPADAILRAPVKDSRAIAIATWVALICLALVLLASLGRVVVPLGRRRGWRPTKAEIGA